MLSPRQVLLCHPARFVLSPGTFCFVTRHVFVLSPGTFCFVTQHVLFCHPARFCFDTQHVLFCHPGTFCFVTRHVLFCHLAPFGRQDCQAILSLLSLSDVVAHIAGRLEQRCQQDSPQSGLKSCVHRETGLGSHSLPHSSPFP